MQATCDDGVVRVINHGSDRASKTPTTEPPDPHYVRLAYSTHTAPRLGAAAPADPVDNSVTVFAPDGRASQRRTIERIGVADRCAASAYRNALAGGAVRVVTATVLGRACEIRVHAFAAPPRHTVRDSGYALAGDPPLAREAAALTASVSRPDRLTSRIIGLTGFTAAAVHTPTEPDVFGTAAAVPVLTAPGHPGGTCIYLSVVSLGTAEPEQVTATVAGTQVTVRWGDGETVIVRLGRRPSSERRCPDGSRVTLW